MCVLVLLYFGLIWLSLCMCVFFFFFSSRRRHTRFDCDWSSDVCSSDLADREALAAMRRVLRPRVLATVVQEDRALQDAFLARRLVHDVAPGSQVVADLDALARELHWGRGSERHAWVD